jgi:propanol-preferring alcohol dehydrogenase
MRAMVLRAASAPLEWTTVPAPEPREGEILVKVRACGICRTDLHVADGELPDPKLPLVLGHQVVGTVLAQGPRASRFPLGTRVGIPWLGASCGVCPYCAGGRENLCDRPTFTGYQVDGGLAELCVASERHALALPAQYDDVAAAPLLCAGLIGYRSLRLAGDARRIGLFGFGSAAHIVAQVARHQGREVYAFVRPGDVAARRFALDTGVDWVGFSSDRPPVALDAAIIFATAGELVPAALEAVAKGGSVVCGGIHMSDIPSFPYRLLWGERVLRSVANLTRRDGEEFLALAPAAGVKVQVTSYPLHEANRALAELRLGSVNGSLVVAMEG